MHLFSVLLILVAFNVALGSSFEEELRHDCVHDKLMVNHKGITSSRIFGNVEKRQTFQPLRIVFDTSYLLSDPDFLCTEVNQMVKVGNPPSPNTICDSNCLNTVEGCNCWFACTEEEVLTLPKRQFLTSQMITRSRGNLILESEECNCGNLGVAVPSNHRVNGVANADLLIYVTARPVRFSIGNNTVAFACPCEYEGTWNRPIAGYLNWSPSSIRLNANLFAQSLGVALHEITHILGFTAARFRFFNGSTTAQPSQTVTLTAGSMSHQVQQIITPAVVEKAREHFGCPSLNGVELENGGGSGTALSHWERRLLFNEYMTGVISYEPKVSSISLAFFEDSGWYTANYSAAENLLWGKDEGCSFVQERCSEWRQGLTCSGFGQEKCSQSGLLKSRCHLRTFSESLPPWFRYFDNPLLGGADILADYCPLYQYFPNFEGDCRFSVDQPQESVYNVNPFGQIFCPTCRCLPASTGGAEGASCHNFTCHNDVLKVKIGAIWYDCERDGQVIRINRGNDNGYYQCPTPANKWCDQVGQSPGPWPEFVSISPTEGEAGTTITVKGRNLLTSATVQVGLVHGCISPRVNGDEITCTLGIATGAELPTTTDWVDVVISDGLGRTGVGFRKFLLNSASGLEWSRFTVLLFGVICLFV